MCLQGALQLQLGEDPAWGCWGTPSLCQSTLRDYPRQVDQEMLGTDQGGLDQALGDGQARAQARSWEEGQGSP